VLRDYVKSMKHRWHEAAYIPETADFAAAWKVASRFRELRDDEFTADLALRADGTWRLIELGDGQVSDRPATTEAGPFLNAILPPD
jgi:hypothetical protein